MLKYYESNISVVIFFVSIPCKVKCVLHTSVSYGRKYVSSVAL